MVWFCLEPRTPISRVWIIKTTFYTVHNGVQLQKVPIDGVWCGSIWARYHCHPQTFQITGNSLKKIEECESVAPFLVQALLSRSCSKDPGVLGKLSFCCGTRYQMASGGKMEFSRRKLLIYGVPLWGCPFQWIVSGKYFLLWDKVPNGVKRKWWVQL